MSDILIFIALLRFFGLRYEVLDPMAFGYMFQCSPTKVACLRQ